MQSKYFLHIAQTEKGRIDTFYRQTADNKGKTRLSRIFRTDYRINAYTQEVGEVKSLPDGTMIISECEFNYMTTLHKAKIFGVDEKLAPFIMSPDTLNQALDNNQLGVMFLFLFTNHCPTCDQVKPLVSSFAQQYNNYHDGDLRIAAMFAYSDITQLVKNSTIKGITHVPALLLYHDGNMYEMPTELLGNHAEMLRVLQQATGEAIEPVAQEKATMKLVQ
jgi:thiol-disulfide isomerase/thioredoxin